jgi:hypothetical protein
MFVLPVGYVKAASFPAFFERDKGDRNNIFCIISLSLYRIVVCGTTSLSLFVKLRTARLLFTNHHQCSGSVTFGTDTDADFEP